jgi:hypothetical protein
MRVTIATLALAGTVLAASAPACSAQTAYDYPWCMLRAGRSGGQSCYFTSYRQCMETLSGIGGSCIRSPYYRGPVYGYGGPVPRRVPRSYRPY